MKISDILTPARTLADLNCVSKKRTLESISHWLAEQMPDFNGREVFNALINREKLGSTGFGDGIAIPHCRLSSCTQVTGALIRLSTAVDFDAIDQQPVDLLFVLLVPLEATDEHLQILATLAGSFGQPEYREQLRNAADANAMYQIAIA
ncbi:MAG: PTS IIA-like nitrogen regulatory protein PtsN [Gammaproteobacteria bacterium]|nr:PTS IIA-like nitrogen regulatory protein PtsN [Gammaproteobacteria bacterium]